MPRVPGRRLAARGRVSTARGACVGTWRSGFLKTCLAALPVRPRCVPGRAARRVPGAPEWPAAGQSPGGHGSPHGAAPGRHLGRLWGDGGRGGEGPGIRRPVSALINLPIRDHLMGRRSFAHRSHRCVIEREHAREGQ